MVKYCVRRAASGCGIGGGHGGRTRLCDVNSRHSGGQLRIAHEGRGEPFPVPIDR